MYWTEIATTYRQTLKTSCIWISKVKELDKFDSIFSFEIVNLHVILIFEELKHNIVQMLQIKMLAKEV